MPAPQREITLSRHEIVHPAIVDGRPLWIAPEVQEMIDLLHNGDPTLGWEGDPRLALYRSEGDRWELWRLEHDGEMRMFCRSKPGAKLDRGLIVQLVAHDGRRGFDLKKHVDEANAAVHRANDARISDMQASAADKLAWALRKDLGHLYG